MIRGAGRSAARVRAIPAGQVAITGGGRGLGREIALALAAEGAAVSLAATHAESLEATAADVRQRGGRARIAVVDVADEAAVRDLVTGTIDELGRVDILVNNAGLAGPTAPVADVARDDWDRTLAVNLTGAFLCAKYVLPHLVAQRRGRIVNITSVAGLAGYALRAPYAASKWGMIGLTRTLALEAGPHGVTVNAIAPGPVRGERIDRVIRARAEGLGASVAEVERTYVESTAIKRMVDPGEIAATTLFLCSEAAASITGETLSVTGGMRV